MDRAVREIPPRTAHVHMDWQDGPLSFMPHWSALTELRRDRRRRRSRRPRRGAAGSRARRRRSPSTSPRCASARTLLRSITIDERVKPATLPDESERANRSDTLALSAALVTVVLWASAFVGIRSVSGEFSAGALTLGRLLVGSAMLTVVALGRGARLPRRADLLLLVSCGLLWFGLYNMALNAAEHRVDAGTAAMIVNINPILVAIMAGVFLHEGFPRRLLLGCAIAFSGAMVIGLATSQTSRSAGLGALLCVLAAFASAAGLVLQKPLLRRMSALEGNLARLRDRDGRLPAVRAGARPRGRRRARLEARLGRLPRHLPHGHRLHHVVVRARAHRGGAPGLDDLPGGADRDPARLAAARRDAACDRDRRRCALHLRCRARAAPLSAEPRGRDVDRDRRAGHEARAEPRIERRAHADAAVRDGDAELVAGTGTVDRDRARAAQELLVGGGARVEREDPGSVEAVRVRLLPPVLHGGEPARRRRRAPRRRSPGSA